VVEGAVIWLSWNWAGYLALRLAAHYPPLETREMAPDARVSFVGKRPWAGAARWRGHDENANRPDSAD
jgi:hypothetical protein